MDWHKDTITTIRNYCKQFNENCNIKTDKNCLPLINNIARRENQLYCPDITVMDGQNQITHFIEIVKSSPGKPIDIFGVIFAADISIAIMKNESEQQNIKPKLFFIIQDPKEKYDAFYCHICQKIHKKNQNSDNCINWMNKKASDIEVINNDSNSIPCPICKGSHRRNHNHITWLKDIHSPHFEVKKVKFENKSTRLFDKILENERVMIEIEEKIKHIEFPILCYDTNYDNHIKF